MTLQVVADGGCVFVQAGADLEGAPDPYGLETPLERKVKEEKKGRRRRKGDECT